MNVVFADTFYFIALLDRRDPKHAEAIAASRVSGRRFLTTEFVLLELADAFAKPPQREEFLAICNLVLTDPIFKVVPLTSEHFHNARKYYAQHRDKEWQLSDCISFMVMNANGIKAALTGDRHFIQAGFKALLA
jgi:predicted nucleic acid-binding protein